jgi:hypothetical protein
VVLVALEAGEAFLKLWEVRPYSDYAVFFRLCVDRLLIYRLKVVVI